MTLRVLLILTMALTSYALPVRAQDVTQQIWLDYNPRWNLSNQTQIVGEAGFRDEFAENLWNRSLLGVGARRDLPNGFRTLGGLRSLYTANQLINDRWELRPWVGGQLIWPTGRLPIQHYARVEQRLDYNTSTWAVASATRFRYRVRASYRLSALEDDRYWRLMASVEAFATLAGDEGQFREQARLGFGIERSLGRTLGARAQFTWQRTGRILTPGSVSDFYLRFRVFQTFGA